MENDKRSQKHQRNQAADEIMSGLSDMMSAKDRELRSDLPESERPNIYLLGCARSGTTLLHQYLIKHFDLAYPSNFLSRFFYAPYTGARMQYLLHDLDAREELLGGSNQIEMSSDLGKTKGPLSPHEFTFYWKEHFDIGLDGYIDHPNNDQVDSFRSGINAIKHVFDKAFVMKALQANACIQSILKPKDLVIYVKRDIALNAQSLLQAREAFFGDRNQWYSFGASDELKSMSPEEQVVNQILKTNAMVEKTLAKINDDQKVVLNYDDFNSSMPSIQAALEQRGVAQLTDSLTLIDIQNKQKVDDETWNKIQAAIDQYQ